MICSYHRKRLTELMLQGMVRPAEVAEALDVTPQAVLQWVCAEDARNARRYRARQIVAAVLKEQEPDVKVKAAKRYRRHPQKRTLIALLRKGMITVQDAARSAGIPVSGVLAWMRIAGIPIPPEHTGKQPYKRARVRSSKLTAESVRYILETRDKE